MHETDEVKTGLFYTYNSVHRNNMINKSQWQISKPEELRCFVRTDNREWIVGSDGWGLHLEDDCIKYLGVAQDHLTQVFIAKFKNDTPHNTWHGYPADHQTNAQDVPDRQILKNWLEDDLLPKSKIRKIMGMKPCKL